MKSQISYIDEELSLQSDSDHSPDYSPASQSNNQKKQKIKKPKRNKSAFILFSSDMRPALKSQTNSNSNEMMVKLAELWKNLPAVKKGEYNDKAKQDKERYNKELAIYSQANPTKEIHNRTKNNHVKKPCSAYALFVKSIKESIKGGNKGLKMADVFKIISQKWKELSKSEKEKFEEMSKVEKKIAKEKQREIMAPKKAGSKPHTSQKDQDNEEEVKSSRKAVKRELKVETTTKIAEMEPISDISDFDKVTDDTSKPSKSSGESPMLISIFEEQFETQFLGFGTVPPGVLDTDIYFAKEEDVSFFKREPLQPDFFDFDLLNFTLQRETPSNMNLFDDY